MAINKAMRKVLKALSFDGIEVEASRHLANLKALDPMRIFHKTIDYKIYNGTHEIPVRIYLPGEEIEHKYPVLLFFHGGGWVTESIDNYERICARMASATNHIVVSVEYRLAPEYPFPTGLEDCYAAAKAVYTNEFILNVHPDDITIIGDSAGGNLAAAVSLLAKERGEFMPRQQILIYPADERTQAALCEVDYGRFEELDRKIKEAMAALPDSYREAFVMHRFKELSYKEIAEVLDVSPQTVAYRIQQALKLLRVSLKEYLPMLVWLVG